MVSTTNITSDYGDSLSSGIINNTPETDQYTNISPLSTGGPFFILKAKRNGKWYTLKGINSAYQNISLYETILKREFETGSQLSHNNIANTLYLDELKEYGKVIVLEYIDGCTLSDFLKKPHNGSDINKIIKELFDAVEYIHQHQILHRDLKPNNIMVTYNGHNVKLIDLGLCDEDSSDLLKQSVGTNKYAAPEQLAGQSPLDCRADIYSLGKILNDIFPNADRKTKKIIIKCTNKDRGKRPANIYELRNLWEQRFQNRILMSIAIVLLLAMSGAIFFFLTSKNEKESVIVETEIYKQNPNQTDNITLVHNTPPAPTKKEDVVHTGKTKVTEQTKVLNKDGRPLDKYLNNIKDKYRRIQKTITSTKDLTFEEAQYEIHKLSRECSKLTSEYKNLYGYNTNTASEITILEVTTSEYITKLQAEQRKLPMIQNEISSVRNLINDLSLKDTPNKNEELGELEVREAELVTKLNNIMNKMNHIYNE